MSARPINKNNPKNIYCDHCEHYKKSGETNRFGWPICKCENPDSPNFQLERNYWNRCKGFEWKKSGFYCVK